MNDILEVPGAWRLFAEGGEGGRAVEWGLAALEHGLDSPHLRRLAGLGDSTPWYEVEPIFLKAVEELGAEAISEEIARRHHLIELLREIDSASTDIDTVISEIERTVVAPLGHPPDLAIWCLLDDDIVPDRVTGKCSQATRPERDQVARDEARRILQAEAPK